MLDQRKLRTGLYIVTEIMTFSTATIDRRTITANAVNVGRQVAVGISPAVMLDNSNAATITSIENAREVALSSEVSGANEIVFAIEYKVVSRDLVS